jgi:uncharacterized lipoprotein YddW (UPF0748 family)
VRMLAWFCVGFIFVGAADGGEVPAPPKTGYPLVDSLRYENDQAARAAWRPMAGSPGVSIIKIGVEPVLKMPCVFAGTAIERASWDRSVSLDLSGCQGIQFHVFCPDPSPVSYGTCYLESGGGWYAVTFPVRTQGRWQTITIDKDEARIEGKPAGWGSIRTIRISAWRGKDVSTTLYIAGLGLAGSDATIAVLRADSAAKTAPSEERGARTFTEAVGEALKDLGLAYCTVSDQDLTEKTLPSRFSVVILPHNPGMPDDVAERVSDFLREGGKLVCFYALPEKLRPLVGINGGRHIEEDRPGQFASIHTDAKVLPGAPPVEKQRSWNISEAVPVEGKSRVAAMWYDDQEKPSGQAAIVASDNCIQMTHVLLPNDAARKRRLLLAMIGRLVPEAWHQSIRHRVDTIGRFGPYAGFEEARDALRSLAAKNEAVLRLVDQVASLRGEAMRLGTEGKYAEALDAADECKRLLLKVHCAAQTPLKGEHRAFWCHSAFGVDGMTWDEAIKNLADHGFTAILPNMLWGGVAFYPGKVLPVAEGVEARGDQIAQCLGACRKYGVACHVWKVNFNMGWATPKPFVEEMERQHRTQVRFDGKPEARWLCPSNPANQKLEIDAMVEVATKYDVDGIHFDYIRYPGAHCCFCDGCRDRFEKTVGRKMERWPGDVRLNGKYEGRWLDFRRQQITAVVAGVAEMVRKVRPKEKISAAVFDNWPTYRDSIGQDWRLWCEKGYLDFVCPMDYTADARHFEKLVEQQIAWAGKVPCYPGIGLSVWRPGGDICKLIEMVGITRRFKTGGFTVFNYAVPEAREVVPLCGMGLTKRQ